jgi:hypothetical protein
MDKHFYCCHCKRRAKKNPRLKPGQRYCGLQGCQQARKNRHERERLKSDPEYYARRKSQKADWQKRQQGVYQRNYRENHLGYLEQNRLLQRMRYQGIKTRPVPVSEPKIVKTDASAPVMPIGPGLYEIRPYKMDPGKKIVKTDALIVALSIHGGFQEDLAGDPAIL